MPSHARAVVVGGGVIGCSTAYHLARLGWQDVLVLERKQVSSGNRRGAAECRDNSDQGPYRIEPANRVYTARTALTPMYDEHNLRFRG